MSNKTTLLLALIACFFINVSSAQKGGEWTLTSSKVKAEDIRYNRDHMPTKYELYSLDTNAMLAGLRNAPMRTEELGRSQNVISVPNPFGKPELYAVKDSEIMHPELAAKFPNIGSYVGESLSTPGKYVRISMSPSSGFHAQVFTAGEPTMYIDPYSKDLSVYIAYKRDDMVNLNREEFLCETDNFMDDNTRRAMETATPAAKDINDRRLRRYELAMSCAGEYGEYFLALDGTPAEATDAEKKAVIMAQMVVAMDRVNGVYEKEMGITYQFIPNNDLLIYYDSATDPWDGEYNDKTQEVIDMVIGDENYDIGHNFNIGGGGNAGCIGCVCNTGNKGSGYTGLNDPTGDPFYIDYVAHEIGHQIGGYHTHNGAGTCLRSGNMTEVEPGSGSSIMGYAGICPGQDIQNQSDDYFASVNIRDISANIQTGVSSQCHEEIFVANMPPTVDAGADYSIPIGTAFRLTAAESVDPDTDDVVTYTWEANEFLPMAGLTPQPTDAIGPLFRSRRGTTSRFRYLPQLSDIMANNLAPTWEVIPMVERDYNFLLTVRDNVAYGGQSVQDDMTVSFVTAPPFLVTTQTTATTWTPNEEYTVAWEVGLTDIAPINCAIVDVLFSPDGTFSEDTTITLADDVPNNGSATVISPNLDTTTGRVMVVAADNIFLDVNNGNISIEEVLSVDDISSGLNNLRLYPNPTNGVVFVDMVQFNNLDVVVFDLLGREVVSKSITNNDNSINMTNLSTGAYIVQFTTENNEKSTQRLIVE